MFKGPKKINWSSLMAIDANANMRFIDKIVKEGT